jgi:hypothetical protein
MEAMTQDAPIEDHDADDKVVETIWKVARVSFPPIAAEVDGEPCRIMSVTARPSGSTFVNLMIGDRKRSLVAANHSWTREQMEINDSAFFGVLSGAPADAALRYEPSPKTLAEARAKDRAKAVGKRFFLKCREGDQTTSWRLVSGVDFGPEYLDAISHFDWGEKQRFAFDIIAEVVDARTDRKLTLGEMKADVERDQTAKAEVERDQTATVGAGTANGGFRLAVLFLVAATVAGVLSYVLLGAFMTPANAPPQSPPPATAPTSGAAEPQAGEQPQSAAPVTQTPASPAPAPGPTKKPRRGRTN